MVECVTRPSCSALFKPSIIMLKKILFALTAMLCLTACDEDYTDWNAPQSNPQEEAKDVVLSVTPAADIDLSAVTDPSIEVAQWTVSQPEGFITDSMAIDEVAADGTLTPLPLTDGKVQVADLASVVTKEYGRRPELRTLQLKVSVYSWTDAEKTDRVCATKTFSVNVKPVAPVFESAYYYIGVLGTDKSYPMTKLADGVFSVDVPANGGWHWFKIAPESGFGADGNFDWANEGNCLCATSKDDEAAEGKFVVGGDKNSWHLIEPDGATSFTITVDLYDMTYSITPHF